MNTPTVAAPNFDRVAHIYRWSEYIALGPLLERTRFHFLPQLAASRHAWVLGDGDGRFLARLLHAHPALQATAIETSAAMLRLLTRRIAHTSPASLARLQTINTSALAVSPPPATDLIVTHFFLDCLPQPDVDTLARDLAAAVAPGCLWLVSDFAIPPHPLLRPFATLYLRALYLSFRILTGLRVTHLPDPASALHAAGFARIQRRNFLAGLLYTELWQRTDTPPSRISSDTISRPALDALNSSMPPTPTSDRQHPGADRPLEDALPNPEPIAPSLPEPDPGVFHHEPAPLNPSIPRKQQ